MPPIHLICRRTLLLVAVALVGSPQILLAQRYQAWLRDGQLVTGEKISGWMTETGSGTLDGRNMFEAGNPIRTLRDTSVRVDPVGPFVQMANGDLLPGKLSGHEPDKGHYVVTLETASSGPEFEPAQLLVNEAALMRAATDPGAPALQAGGVELGDGRRYACRAIRVHGQRVQLLTKEGISTVALADIRQLTMPGDPLEEILSDGVWTPPEPNPPSPNSILRIRSSGGAQITVPKSLARVVEVDGKKWLYLRPTWANHTLRILRDRIAWWSFREDGEVPLATLPAQTLKESALISHRPWRRNASVEGLELVSGKMGAEQGVGTSSYSAIAFQLPSGVKEFSAWVGLDRRVGNGGCVKLKIQKDELNSPSVWESDFLVGGKEPVRVGPFNIAGAKRLILVTDFAHDGRPAGADPLDIRDHVAWLNPLVTVGKESLPPPQRRIARWLPPLDGWKLADSSLDRVRLQTAFDPERREFHLTFVSLEKLKDSQPVELERSIAITPGNMRLLLEASSDGQRKLPAKLRVLAEGEPRESTMNGDVDTAPTSFRKPQSREYGLGDLVGKTAKLTVQVLHPNRGDGDMNGLIFWNLSLLPGIEGLPESGGLASPDVPLASLTPRMAVKAGKALELPAAGQRSDGKPLEIHHLKMAGGFGLPAGSEVTYDLEPNYERFTAIIGLASGWQNAGPFEILIDGQPHWTSAPVTFGRNSPGQYIDVPLPDGGKQITLRILGGDCLGAWANAGFVKRK
jgi:hypothetical protein